MSEINLNELVKEDNKKKCSNYVLAGAETLVGLLNKFIYDTGDEYFTKQSLNNFFSYNCNKFLHSYGISITPKTKINNKFNRKVSEKLSTIRDNNIFSNVDIFVDSGGFQVSIGRVEKNIIPDMINYYYSFLSEYNDKYSYAFALDLVPGPNCKAFENFDDVYNLNYRSYDIASKVDSKVRDKIYYIHHFRTPKLLSIFRQILFQTDLYKHFQNFATGGIVANMASDVYTNIILYIIPLIDLLYKTKEEKRDYLNFHILGGANFRDIFFYELLKLHVKKFHNIDLNITFDSSSIFKGLMIARFIYVLHSDNIYSLDLKEKNLNNRWNSENITIREKLNQIMFEFSKNNNFSNISFDNIYDPETQTFYHEHRIYLMLYVLNFYYEIQEYLKQLAQDIYSFYDDEVEFTNRVSDLLQKLNKGKLTRKQKSKSYSIRTSLKAVTDLDLDYSEHLVDKFLSKDEFTYLYSDQKVLTF